MKKYIQSLCQSPIAVEQTPQNHGTYSKHLLLLCLHFCWGLAGGQLGHSASTGISRWAWIPTSLCYGLWAASFSLLGPRWKEQKLCGRISLYGAWQKCKQASPMTQPPFNPPFVSNWLTCKEVIWPSLKSRSGVAHSTTVGRTAHLLGKGCGHREGRRIGANPSICPRNLVMNYWDARSAKKY